MYLDMIEQAAGAAPQDNRPAPLVPGLVLHVDGDYLAYYASGKDETTQGEARLNAIGIIDGFRAKVGAEKVVVHNTERGCHKGERFLVATVKPYQGQRDGDRKPKNHAYLQQWLMDYEGDLYQAKNWRTREADDGIGACAHFAVGKAPGYVAIATRDKDLRMLPGYHLDWLTRDVTVVNPGDYEVIGSNGKLYGLKWFWQQMLEGDTADNCPGLERIRTDNKDGSFKGYKKCGPKTAEDLLRGAANSDEAGMVVWHEYKRAYSSYVEPVANAADRFVEQAALLWMRCGRTAEVTDFADHAGHSRINSFFDEELWAAVKRLDERVKSARNEINSLRS